MAALGTIAKTGEQLKCTRTDEWIQKVRYIYTMQYCSDIKKDEIMPFPVIGKKPQVTKLSEITDKRKDDSITSVGSKMDTNERHYKMQTDSQTQKRMLTKMERWQGVGGVISWYRSIFICQN